MDHALRLAPADLNVKALHRHNQVQGLHPLDRDPHGIMTAEILDLGPIFAFDCFEALPLAAAPGIVPITRAHANRSSAVRIPRAPTDANQALM